VSSDGSRIDLSAKRQYRLDAQFRKTVDQWKDQVDELGPGDRLGLVVAEPASTVVDLGEALRRRRAGTLVYSVDQQSALDGLNGLLAGLSQEQIARILDAAHVLKVHAREGRQSGVESDSGTAGECSHPGPGASCTHQEPA